MHLAMQVRHQVLFSIVWAHLCIAAEVDVIVVGAGPAGLSTVSHLQALKGNVSILLLDKTDRIGGRSRTLKFGTYGVDLGPAWIHYGTANPLTYLATRGNCSTVRTRNLNMNVYHAGKLVPRSVVLDMFQLLDDVEAGYNHWRKHGANDDSLLHVIQEIFRWKRLQLSPQQKAAFATILYGEIVEDWTAPLHELSAVRHCEYDSVDGVGSDWRVVEGMECIIRQILEPSFENVLKRHVKSVRLEADLVRVGGDGWTISSRVAVLALPLGELKEEVVRVEPLPDWKREAWKELGLGHAIRVALEFSESFWPSDVEFFMDFNSNCTESFLEDVDLCSIEFTAPVFGTFPPALVAEADGRLAERLASKSDVAVVEFLLGRLSEMFGDLPELKSSYVLRPWGLPFWRKGSSGRPAARLAGEPIDGRLFFAGDYVSHNVGTVAGAFLSGVAAAHAVACKLGQRLDLEALPTVAPMIQKPCAEEILRSQDRCNTTLWDLLYRCSALPSLDDDSGRACFVQGHDMWHDPRTSWTRNWRNSFVKSVKRLLQRTQALFNPPRHPGMQATKAEI